MPRPAGSHLICLPRSLPLHLLFFVAKGERWNKKTQLISRCNHQTWAGQRPHWTRDRQMRQFWEPLMKASLPQSSRSYVQNSAWNFSVAIWMTWTKRGHFKSSTHGLGSSTVAECLASTSKALGSIPSTTSKFKKKNVRNYWCVWLGMMTPTLNTNSRLASVTWTHVSKFGWGRGEK